MCAEQTTIHDFISLALKEDGLFIEWEWDFSQVKEANRDMCVRQACFFVRCWYPRCGETHHSAKCYDINRVMDLCGIVGVVISKTLHAAYTNRLSWNGLCHHDVLLCCQYTQKLNDGTATSATQMTCSSPISGRNFRFTVATWSRTVLGMGKWTCWRWSSTWAKWTSLILPGLTLCITRSEAKDSLVGDVQGLLESHVRCSLLCNSSMCFYSVYRIPLSQIWNIISCASIGKWRPPKVAYLDHPRGHQWTAPRYLWIFIGLPLDRPNTVIMSICFMIAQIQILNFDNCTVIMISHYNLIIPIRSW